MAGVVGKQVVVIAGVSYVLEGGMLWRYFVKLDANGVVIQDLESGRESWVGIVVPSDLIDVTASAQWNGVGSLMHYTRNQDGTFAKPAAPAADQTVTALRFLGLFSVDERKAIRLATDGNIATSMSPDPDVADLSYQLNTKMAQDGRVDLSDPALAAGLDLITAKGLIAPGRKAQILANQVPS
jgi:hypothetical protein